MAIWDPSTLAQLSAPGFNRNLGTGDVVPYWGPAPGATASDAGVATPGAAYDPNAGINSPNGAGGAGADAGVTTDLTAPGGAAPSMLNNLSMLQPILDAIMQQQQAASVGSGQGNALPSPFPTAAPGPSSSDIGALMAAGAAPASPVSPVPGIAPSPGPSTGDAAGGPGVGNGAPSGAGAGAAAGGTASGPDAGPDTSDAGPTGEGDAGGGPSGDGGAGAGAGGDGGAY